MLVDKQRGAAPRVSTIAKRPKILRRCATRCSRVILRCDPMSRRLRAALGPSCVSSVPAGRNDASESDLLLGRETELARSATPTRPRSSASRS